MSERNSAASAAAELATAESLAALGYLGYTRRDSLPLRFSFEAAGLRHAVDLAGDLRTGARGSVRVRPVPLKLLSRRRWTVTLTTLPISLELDVIRAWERDMRGLALARPGCCLVGWNALLAPGSA